MRESFEYHVTEFEVDSRMVWSNCVGVEVVLEAEMIGQEVAPVDMMIG